MAGDANPTNDTSNLSLVVLQPKISTFPYSQNFDSEIAYWLTGTNGTRYIYRYFTLGPLPDSYLNGPDGQGNSYYLVVPTQACCQNVWAESPVFDFSNQTNPTLSMDIKYSLPFYYGYNNVTVQYSIDGGSTWTVLGLSSDPQWYNTNDGNYVNDWGEATVTTWTHVQHNLCILSEGSLA